jgi:hypothetical protein
MLSRSVIAGRYVTLYLISRVEQVFLEGGEANFFRFFLSWPAWQSNFRVGAGSISNPDYISSHCSPPIGPLTAKLGQRNDRTLGPLSIDFLPRFTLFYKQGKKSATS